MLVYECPLILTLVMMLVIAVACPGGRPGFRWCVVAVVVVVFVVAAAAAAAAIGVAVAVAVAVV